ncbi:Hypothetical predicted protein [Lecanosticta acicola]|uniref:Uncharacterized protein n=1 Tax=Lecanosticta acicola TaxID=111012 RepID=A0AAI9EAI1_9PEZI|nr:Hypothetical predicted protein [Lecanosticta acicola]
MSFRTPSSPPRLLKIILNDPDFRNDRIGRRHHLFLDRVDQQTKGKQNAQNGRRRELELLRLGYEVEDTKLSRQQRQAKERSLERHLRWREKTDLGSGAITWYLERDENERYWASRRIRSFPKRKHSAARTKELKGRYEAIKQRRKKQDLYLTPGELNMLQRTFEKQGTSESRGTAKLTRDEKVDNILARLRAADPAKAPAPALTLEEPRALQAGH